MNLKIEYVPINTIKEYEKNAKLHPDEQVEQIRKSIEQFGMCDPIAVWGNENEIVEGHGRLLACKQLGHTYVPIIRLDDLTDNQRKAYALVHNKLTMNSDFDLVTLAEELENIDCVDMADFGFLPDEEELEDALDDFEEAERQEQEGHLVECPCCGNTFTLNNRFQVIE